MVANILKLKTNSLQFLAEVMKITIHVKMIYPSLLVLIVKYSSTYFAWNKAHFRGTDFNIWQHFD